MAVDKYLKNSAICGWVASFSLLFGVILTFVGRYQWYSEHECKPGALNHLASVAFSDLFIVVTFVCYAQICCEKRKDTDTKWKWFQMMTVGVLGIMVGKMIGAYYCKTNGSVRGLSYIFLFLSAVGQWSNYWVVYNGRFRHKRDVHLSTFLIMAISLFIEIIVELKYKHSAGSFMAFNYFNVKIGVVVFEIYEDTYCWTKCDTNSILFFAFYLAVRLARQIYYFAVFNEGWTENWEIVFGISGCLEALCCFAMVYYIRRSPVDYEDVKDSQYDERLPLTHNRESETSSH
jgi:hypothetical protein